MLSLCVAGRTPHRIRFLAELLRGAAGEIVVAVDSRVPTDELGQLEPVVDTLLRFEYADPPERVFAWLHAQATGDWLLRLDDDEVPSRALLDALPRLVADETLTHYWLLRRWLFPTVETYLDELPWSPNHELRLVRNDPRFVRFPGVMHLPAEADGPGAWLDEAIYHLDLVVNDRAARRAKAERYELLRPGLRTAGRALNAAVYLPEGRDAPLGRVPDEDLPLIRGLLDAPGERREADPRLAAREEIDAHWPARPLPDSAYRAELALASRVEPLPAGTRKVVDVRVRNCGTETWRRRRIRLGYHWPGVVHDGLQTALPHDAPPGAELLVPLTVEAPARPDDYELELDLVHEGVRWFGGGPRVAVHVTRPKRLALYVGPDPDDGLAARLAARSLEDPDTEVVVIGAGPRERLLRGLTPGRGRAANALRVSARTFRLLATADDELFELLRGVDALAIDEGVRADGRLDAAVTRAVVLCARRAGVRVLD